MQKIVSVGGKRIKLDDDMDEFLCSVGNMRDGGRMLSFWAHRLKSAGKLAQDAEPNPEDYVFYLLHTTCWQGENNYIQEMTLEEAREFAQEHYSKLDHTLNLLDESTFE